MPGKGGKTMKLSDGTILRFSAKKSPVSGTIYITGRRRGSDGFTVLPSTCECRISDHYIRDGGGGGYRGLQIVEHNEIKTPNHIERAKTKIIEWFEDQI